MAKRFRHAAIFGALQSLNAGETMRFVNDHDPLPLLAQLQQAFGEGLGINYVRREPGRNRHRFPGARLNTATPSPP